MSETQLLKIASESLPVIRESNGDRQLLIDSKQFAVECRKTSWLHLTTSLMVLGLLVFFAASNQSMWIRVLCSGLSGLALVRMFILYHDYLHNSIFGGSIVAGSILKAYGNLMLCPPCVWKHSHDYHHHNNCKIFGANIGSFPVMTTACYQGASRLERFYYRVARSPFVLLFGYFTVFLFGMCIYPMIFGTKKNYGGLVSMAAHFGLIGVSVYFWGWTSTTLAFIAPTFIAMIIGSYLFYVQHNFPDGKIRTTEDWTYSDAALCSSSYLELGPVMRWFTGNIGYHHVHHLNAKIPFYRLPDAMAQLDGLQRPGRTSLRLRDIAACLRLKLWDIKRDQFVPFDSHS
ncbi:MAG: fatty acid desaturase [Pirellulales bacterium]